MDSNLPETLLVDAFEMRLADIADVDVSKLHALSVGVGWPHRQEDWEELRQIGKGLVAIDEIDRVSGSVMWFPHGENFATVAMLITSPRLQSNGTSRWLAQQTFAACKGRKLRINATRAARSLCKSMGFTQQKTIFQCQGIAKVPALESAYSSEYSLRKLESSDLAAIIEFDTPAFAVPRPVHLKQLFESSVCYGLYEGDQLRAYSMCRPFGRGHVVGPVAALSEEDAIAVVRPHVETHAGTFLRLDTHFENGTFANFVQQCEMAVFDTVTTMTFGDNVDYGSGENGQPVIFTLASQSLG